METTLSCIIQENVGMWVCIMLTRIAMCLLNVCPPTMLSIFLQCFIYSFCMDSAVMFLCGVFYDSYLQDLSLFYFIFVCSASPCDDHFVSCFRKICKRGLGKTIQTIAFLAAVYGKDGDSGESTSLTGNQVGKKGPVLIVCPTSVIHNWECEFSKWATFSVFVYHGPNRDLIFEKLEAHGVEILITSFDSFRIHGSIMSNIQWEIVVVDEVHRLKNEKSKLYIACLEIKTLKRYGLTGTVMQNKIMELFNLFDWVVPGSLGTREHFRQFYDEPLKHGQRSTARETFVRIADERKQHLVEVLRKYLLRRTKEETIGHLMMGKEDNVVFCAMSELQKRIYRRILQLPDIQCLINKDLPCSCGSPLKQVECCRRIVPDGIVWRYIHRDNPDGCDSCPFCLVLPCLIKLQQVTNLPKCALFTAL